MVVFQSSGKPCEYFKEKSNKKPGPPWIIIIFVYLKSIMKTEKITATQDPKKIEKELGEFLNKKFGPSVKIISPSIQPQADAVAGKTKDEGKKALINFDIKPKELIAYLDQ